MSRIRLHISTILIFLAWNGLASSGDTVLTEGDSLLIQAMKKFVEYKSGFKLDKSFYTFWSKSEKPYIVLYVSSSKKVERVGRFLINHFGRQEEAAKKKALEQEKLGHHTLVYKTYATASAELNKRFLSYSIESKCFIMFHEFFHHYKRELKLAMPLEYEEALGDVVGNYGAMEFIYDFDNPKLRRVKDQMFRNEKIYKIINNTADKINLVPENVDGLNHRCQKHIEKILMKGNQFQKDRFGYEVNNGFLMKNRFYSEKYFMLKKVFQRSGSLGEFLKIIDGCPSKPEDFERYINGFL